jgi:hypothetical protein
MVVEAKWKSKELTLIGGRSSSIKVNSSSISRTKKLLMLKVQKMLKLNQLLLINNIMEETRNGKLSMLKMLQQLKPRE